MMNVDDIFRPIGARSYSASSANRIEKRRPRYALQPDYLPKCQYANLKSVEN